MTDMAHDRARALAYKRWYAMVRRCTNPIDAAYKDYGGRGISVCQRWADSFEAFYADVGDPPAPGLSLDRIDNDGGYEPGNVRWATWSEQILNRRATTLKTHCRQGHPFDPANTYRGGGQRTCRACRRARPQFIPNLRTDKALLCSLVLERETGGDLPDTLTRLVAAGMSYRQIAAKLHTWTGQPVSFRTTKNWIDALKREAAA
jgi:hypothetical protein